MFFQIRGHILQGDCTSRLATPPPDTQSSYAGTQAGKLLFVVVDKNPDIPISFYPANLPAGTTAKINLPDTTTMLQINTVTYCITVPANTAIFLQNQQGIHFLRNTGRTKLQILARADRELRRASACCQHTAQLN